MATMNTIFNGNNKFGNGTSIFDADRYRNLNIKANFTSTESFADHFTKTSSSHRDDSFGVNNVVRDRTYVNDFIPNIREATHGWKESLTSNLIKTDIYAEKGVKQRENVPSKASSTLLLHIAAYENSIDAGNGDKNDVEEEQATKISKKFGEQQDLFGFYRQQPRQQCTEMEIMEFKTSAKLLNPSKHPSILYPESEDEDDEYADVRAKSLQSKVVVVPDKVLSSSEMKRKLLNELETIEEEKDEIVKKLEALDANIQHEESHKNGIFDQIEILMDRRQEVDAKFVKDYEASVERVLNAIKDRACLYEKFLELEKKQAAVEQKIRDHEKMYGK